MKPSKPEDYPLLWVWDINRSKAQKLRVTFIFPNGACSALDSDGTGDDRYHHCEEIKEIEYMTREQAVCFMAQNPTYVARINGSCWGSDRAVTFALSRENYEWTTTTGYKYGEPHKFTTDYLEGEE